CLRPFGVFRSHFIQELPRNRQKARFLTRQEALLHSTDREREPRGSLFLRTTWARPKNSPPCPAVGATAAPLRVRMQSRAACAPGRARREPSSRRAAPPPILRAATKSRDRRWRSATA